MLETLSLNYNDMKKQEQALTTEFQKWLKHNWKTTGVFEVKVARDGKSFPFRELKAHQKRALRSAGSKFVYKIPDLGYQNPFDLLMITESPGYVVIFYPRPREAKVFYMIEVSVIEEEIESGAKKIDETRANEICFRLGVLC